MKILLASEGTKDLNFVHWVFIGGIAFILGIIFPGLYSLFVSPIGLIIVGSAIWHFSQFKSIYFDENSIFVGKNLVGFDFASIQSIKLIDDFFLNDRTYRMTLQTQYGIRSIKFALLDKSSLNKFIISVKGKNEHVILDIKDAVEKLKDFMHKT